MEAPTVRPRASREQVEITGRLRKPNARSTTSFTASSLNFRRSIPTAQFQEHLTRYPQNRQQLTLTHVKNLGLDASYAKEAIRR